jgi:hypothetical protein
MSPGKPNARLQKFSWNKSKNKNKEDRQRLALANGASMQGVVLGRKRRRTRERTLAITKTMDKIPKTNTLSAMGNRISIQQRSTDISSHRDIGRKGLSMAAKTTGRYGPILPK